MSLVLELQRDIIENKMSTQDILRKAYLISKKLNVDNISEWLNFEMNGYSDKDSLPKYRKSSGTVQALDPYHGWQNVQFENYDDKVIFSELYFFSSISELESLFRLHKDTLTQQGGMLDALNINGDQRGKRILFSKSSIENIFGVVKNKILEWTLDLEDNGILGENMTFTEKEKQNASNIIYNFHGDNTRVNNGSTDNSTNIVYNNPEVIKQLNALKDEVNKLENNSKESLEIIETIEEQLKSKQPNKTIVKSLLGALPKIANIISIGTAILSFL